MKGRRPTLLVASAMLAGCTVGPNYHAPDAQAIAPARFAEPAVQPPTGVPPVDLRRWWQAFGDPELDRLVALALQDNPTVLTAQSRIREARLSVVSARSAAFPQVTAQGTGQRQELSHGKAKIKLGQLLGTQGSALGIAPDDNESLSVGGNPIRSYTAGFDATWEIDLFGGVRRQVEAARAQAQAAEYNAQDTAISLSAEVANDYLALRLAQQRYHVVEAEVTRQQRSLQILQETAEVGLVPQSNFTRQRTQLANTQAQLPPLVSQAKTQIHAIAILTGRAPAALFDEIATERQPPTPPPVPTGLTSDLLRRRPDIRAAKRNLASATAQIGVAVADLYPRITLTGMAQLVSYALGNIASLHALSTTGAASGTFPILDFGRRRATVGIRREEAEQAYLSYQQTVLGAFRDVDDALARVASDQATVATLQGGLADGQRSVQALAHQFDVGLTDFTGVLDAQQTVLQTSDQLAQAQGQEREDLVSLYKALGGGWDPAANPFVPPRPDRDEQKKDRR